MTRRPIATLFTALLLTGMAVLPACKKKTPDSGSGSGGDPAPGPGAPAASSSDYILFAHLRVKDLRDSALFAEVKEAFAKAGGTAEWDELEGKFTKEMGFKPTELDSVTAFVTDVSKEDGPRYVVILSAAKAIDKSNAFGFKLPATPDARGLYPAAQKWEFTQPGKKPPPPTYESYVHFPDAKTAVLVSTEVANQYLNGYAKNRTGWPMTAELSKAASGHTLYAALKMDKVPNDLLRGPDAEEFAPLLTVRAVTLTANLKGKELSVGARATFPNATAAGNAKNTVQKYLGMALGEIEKVMSGKSLPELSGMLPAVKEAHRALKDAKIEVAGSDLTVAGSYKANFAIGPMVMEAVKQIRESAEKTGDQNNLKQIGIGLHTVIDATGRMPIHAIGAKGVALAKPSDKPLLSWRVAILPYIEQENLYKQFKLDEPWDSANNKKLIEMMPKVYAPLKPGKPGYTHLQMVIGPSALQPGMQFPASFSDGTSNTIAVVEAAEPVIWTKPDDVMLPGNQPPKDLKKKFGGQRPGGFNVLLWDGSVRFIKDSISDKTLGLALNPRDGQILGSDW